MSADDTQKTNWKLINRCTDLKCGWHEGTIAFPHWSAMALQLSKHKTTVCPACGAFTEQAVGRQTIATRKVGWFAKENYVSEIEWKS